MGSGDGCQTACKPGSVRGACAPRDGHSSGTRIAARLARPTRTTRRKRPRCRPRLERGRRPAVPIRSCSRWGLPCRRRCRPRGALLPHRFALARNMPARRPSRRAGGLFSVALSLGSPPPAVSRHRSSVEPGLSSIAAMRQRPSSRLATGPWAGPRARSSQGQGSALDPPRTAALGTRYSRNGVQRLASGGVQGQSPWPYTFTISPNENRDPGGPWPIRSLVPATRYGGTGRL